MFAYVAADRPRVGVASHALVGPNSRSLLLPPATKLGFSFEMAFPLAARTKK